MKNLAFDKEFLKFLLLIKKEAVDERNFVRKAVNWALRQIWKRNINLNEIAIKTAKEQSDQARNFASFAQLFHPCA